MKTERIIEILEDIIARTEDDFSFAVVLDKEDCDAIEKAVKILKSLHGMVDFVKDSTKER